MKMKRLSVNIKWTVLKTSSIEQLFFLQRSVSDLHC